VGQIINAINGTANLKVNAELSANGSLQLEATGANGITVGGTATGAELAQFGLTAGATTAGTVNATRTSLASQYNHILTHIDQLASDPGFNGVNLLAGQTLQVVFNGSRTSSLALSGVTFNSAGLGISQSANSFQTNTSLANAASQLTASLSTLQNQAASFGTNLSVIQIRPTFTPGAASISLAATTKKGPSPAALQTRQPLADTALPLAPQSQNRVLPLFG